MEDSTEKAYLLHRIAVLETELGDEAIPACFVGAFSTLEDIKARFEQLDHIKSLKRDVDHAKRALNLCVECMGFVAETTMGVDMSDWQKDIWWELSHKKTYDEVLEELCVKYGGKSKLSPEFRLISMLLLSFGSSLLYKNAMEKMERKYAASASVPTGIPVSQPTKKEASESSSTAESELKGLDDLTELIQKLAEIRKSVADDSCSESSSSSSSTWMIHENAKTTPNDVQDQIDNVIDGYNSF